MTGKTKYLSNSEIQVYKDCPRKWWLQYYRNLRLQFQPETGPLSLGTNVHTALAEYYQRGADPLDVISEIYSDLLDECETDWSGEFRDTTAIRKDADLAKAMIGGYIDWIEETGQDIGLELISTEEAIEVPMEGGYTLRGKLDARLNSDFGPTFIDHKTCASIEQIRATLPINEQAKFYALLEWLAYGEERRTTGVMFNLLRKVKRTARATPPFYAREHVPINSRILETMLARTLSTADRIMNGIELLDDGASHHTVCPPRPDLTCTWRCEFFKVCPMFDDGSNVEGFLEARYEAFDPNERYVTEITLKD